MQTLKGRVAGEDSRVAGPDRHPVALAATERLDLKARGSGAVTGRAEIGEWEGAADSDCFAKFSAARWALSQ